jgi:competence protein ComEC
VLAGYVGVVQNRPPILRAALMAAVFLCSRLLFRRVELLNTMAVAALVLLLVRPSWLFDASYQLSFLAASVIAGLALPGIERSSGPYRGGLAHVGDVTRDNAHPPRVIQFRLDLRAASRWFEARLPPWLAARAASFVAAPMGAALRLWEVAILSATIQLGMLPLLARYFHRVSLSGPASNIPAVLLTALIVPLGFLVLGFSFLWMRLGALFGGFLGWLVTALLTTVSWIARWPRASYRIPGPPFWLLIVFFAVLVGMVVLARTRKRPSSPHLLCLEWLAAAMLAALAVVTYPFPAALERGKLEITVLDVGQGDSIFAAFPGGRTMLIDGGGQYGESRSGGYRTQLDVGEEVVSPYLWQRGLKRIDVVALTHAHHDHLDGLNAVLDNFKVRELWVGRDVDSAAYWSLIQHANVRGVKVVHYLRGARFTWDGVACSVLWPANASEARTASNDDSLVLRLKDDHIAFLLPGDIEHRVEDKLVVDGDPLGAEFLKVPHHGSRTSSTSKFVEAVSPQVAVVSVGEGNPFGQPNPGVVERYKAQKTRLLETDRDGAVTAITDGNSLNIRTYAESHPN